MQDIDLEFSGEVYALLAPNGAGTLPAAAPVGKAENISLPDAEINFDEAVEALGDDRFNVIAGALDMFRRK